MTTEIALTLMAGCGIASAVIGGPKGQGVAGFFLGFLFGPIGVLLAWLSQGNLVRCPGCRELARHDAKVCPRCRSTIIAS